MRESNDWQKELNSQFTGGVVSHTVEFTGLIVSPYVMTDDSSRASTSAVAMEISYDLLVSTLVIAQS